MSAAPDPAELAPSRDPAAYGRRPLFTGAFLGWIVLCLICLAGGAAIGRFGLSPAPAKPAPPAITPASAPLAATPVLPSAGLPSAGTGPMTAQPSSTPTVGDLDARVAKLESASGHADTAAAGALAAAALSVAAESAGPFDQDLAAYERAAPDDPDLRALMPLAAIGAPSRAALAAAFPALASEASAAARQPAADASFFAKAWVALGRVVLVRQVGPNATGADGVLSRAEAQIDAGDLAAALDTLRGLPAPAQPVLQDWTQSAQRRVEIDRRIANVRARALAALTEPAAEK
jgi:hypothetical protein